MSEQLQNILLGVVITIGTGVFLLFIEYRFKIFARQKKQLIYEILATTPLLAVSKVVDEDTAGRLQVLFDAKPVQNVTLLTIRLSNTGNVEIKSEDYERPISIGFNKNTGILKTSVIDKNPPDLPIAIGRWSTGTVTPLGREPKPDMILWHGINIHPILLNSGDYFTLSILTSDFDRNLKVEGRIAGVTAIERRVNSPLRDEIITVLLASAYLATPPLSSFVSKIFGRNDDN